jgi:hypothetical protein
MNPTNSTRTVSRPRRSSRPEHRPSQLAGRKHARRDPRPAQNRRVLADWVDARGREREIIARAAAGGSVVVVDHERLGHGDARLLAHLGPEEPASNAELVCAAYLEASREGRAGCRSLTDGDIHGMPDPGERPERSSEKVTLDWREPLGACERSYRLRLLDSSMSIPQLRWCAAEADRAPHECEPVSLRSVVGHLEAYEPARALTAAALAAFDGDERVSSTVLRAELGRVLESPILLNRRLREVTLSTIASQGVSMSEIAIRCGRVKRDCKGKTSGETSWLGRRVGLLPDGGQSTPTPWIHSEVLALIARRGLGVSPREVEV